MTTAGRHTCWYPWSEVKAERLGGPAPVCPGCRKPAARPVTDPLQVEAVPELEEHEIDALLAEQRRRWAAYLAIGAVLALLTCVVLAIEQGVLS